MELESYMYFMYGRGDNGAPQTPTNLGIPDLTFWNIAYSVWFCILNAALPRLIKFFFPKFYSGLDERKRRELPSWAAGMFHHLVVAPGGFYMIYLDYTTPKSVYSQMDYSRDFYGLHLLTYAFGYIMADTLFFTIPELMVGKWEYAVHHVASLGLYWGLLGTDGAVLRFAPHFMICESSNAIFNTAFFVRNGGGRDGAFLRFLEKSFGLVFFVLRILHFPVVIHAMLSLESSDRLGIGRLVLIPIVFLQFFWLYFIVKALRKKGAEAAAKAAKSN